MTEPSGTQTENKGGKLRELENLIGYKFKNIALLEEAITTSSYSKEHPGSANYQRLELLGDRVISLILTENLIAEESLDEGRMTVLKSELENNQRLAEYGERIGLRNYIRASEQRENISSKVIADV
ncbi:MAG: ribonuclease III domain-containing protein, partial [Candidatus Methanospirareceae archaeon]